MTFDTWYCQACGHEMPSYWPASGANMPSCPACHTFHWATHPKPSANVVSAPLAALTKERDRLREQLDAAREALERIAATPYSAAEEMHAIARAALGVVAAAEQTTDLEANSAKNAEVRGGDNA